VAEAERNLSPIVAAAGIGNAPLGCSGHSKRHVSFSALFFHALSRRPTSSTSLCELCGTRGRSSDRADAPHPILAKAHTFASVHNPGPAFLLRTLRSKIILAGYPRAFMVDFITWARRKGDAFRSSAQARRGLSLVASSHAIESEGFILHLPRIHSSARARAIHPSAGLDYERLQITSLNLWQVLDVIVVL
jgi:hypothetical protein